MYSIPLAVTLSHQGTESCSSMMQLRTTIRNPTSGIIAQKLRSTILRLRQTDPSMFVVIPPIAGIIIALKVMRCGRRCTTADTASSDSPMFPPRSRYRRWTRDARDANPSGESASHAEMSRYRSAGMPRAMRVTVSSVMLPGFIETSRDVIPEQCAIPRIANAVSRGQLETAMVLSLRHAEVARMTASSSTHSQSLNRTASIMLSSLAVRSAVVCCDVRLMHPETSMLRILSPVEEKISMSASSVRLTQSLRVRTSREPPRNASARISQPSTPTCAHPEKSAEMV
mmetsp:Transcript_23228/g.52680  ORF Transcript_23228/g.52680 Transcript_23228/m.52680 type:complete len:285 (+) Transcript_23228:204-1058(+)